jgi:SNF2 family DNA or RNA helicase
MINFRYQEKTCSFRHQRDIFEHTKDIKGNALFWEQGVGKTKPTIDKACYLYETGRIQLLLVLAPNGVHRNWSNDEIPAHMPDRLFQSMLLLTYTSQSAGTKKAERARDEFLGLHHKGIRVLCMSYSAFITKKGQEFARRCLLKFQTYMVADESQYFKAPKTVIAKAIKKQSKLAEYRTALSGTPITQGPFDIYSQIRFCDPDFWVKRNLSPFSCFKKHFGVYISKEDFLEQTGFERSYNQLVDYRNVEELTSLIKLIGHRLTKDSAGIKLPPKLYTKRYFDLTPAQRSFYNTLEEEFLAQLPESGDWVEAPEVIVRLTRLQQITAGYVATAAEEPVQRIEANKMPRLDLLLETLENCEGKAIIWSKFTPDIDMIMDALADKKPVRYDGQVGELQRERNKNEFQKGDARYFIGKPQSGATGLTLHAARSVHYYTNSYNYGHRAQSEDRAHRIGLEHPVLYYDYIASNTIDVDIVSDLRTKRSLAAQVLDDAKKDWI